MQVLAVPVKSLERSKLRLSSVLSVAERAALTLALLEDVLDACLEQAEWQAWVVSPSEAVLEVAARRGARPVPEERPGLVAAVRQAEALVPRRNDALAVVLADLPWLDASSLSSALAVDAPVVAAPATSDGGTNLLVRRPAQVIPARFGRASFAKHRWAARRARVGFEQVTRAELAFDLDRPEDMIRLLAVEHLCRTRAACLEMGAGARLRLSAGGA